MLREWQHKNLTDLHNPYRSNKTAYEPTSPMSLGSTCVQKRLSDNIADRHYGGRGEALATLPPIAETVREVSALSRLSSSESRAKALKDVQPPAEDGQPMRDSGTRPQRPELARQSWYPIPSALASTPSKVGTVDDEPSDQTTSFDAPTTTGLLKPRSFAGDILPSTSSNREIPATRSTISSDLDATASTDACYAISADDAMSTEQDEPTHDLKLQDFPGETNTDITSQRLEGDNDVSAKDEGTLQAINPISSAVPEHTQTLDAASNPYRSHRLGKDTTRSYTSRTGVNHALEDD